MVFSPLRRTPGRIHSAFPRETFNTFNHPQFCPPDVTFGSSSFGQTYYTCNAPREVQMALKFYF